MSEIEQERHRIATWLRAGIPRKRWYDGRSTRIVMEMINDIANRIESGSYARAALTKESGA